MGLEPGFHALVGLCSVVPALSQGSSVRAVGNRVPQGAAHQVVLPRSSLPVSTEQRALSPLGVMTIRPWLLGHSGSGTAVLITPPLLRY